MFTRVKQILIQANFISSKDVNFFERGNEKLPSRWTKIISNDCDYFVKQQAFFSSISYNYYF